MGVAFFTGDTIFQLKITSLVPFLSGAIPDFVTICDIIVVFTVFNSLLFAAYLIYEMISQKETLNGKLYALWGINPIIFVLLNLYLIDGTDEFTIQNAALMIMMIGIIFTLVSTKVIISSMAKMHISSFQIEPLLFSGYFYFHYCYSGEHKEDYVLYSLIAASVVSLVLYFRFVRVSITQITEHLGIYCFFIKEKRKDK